MVSQRFEQAFSRLRRSFARYSDAPRTPDRVVELAAERAELEDARTVVGVARACDGVRRIDPPTTEWVEPGFGTGGTSRIGKLAVVFTLLILGFGVFGVVRILGEDLKISSRFERITEVTEGCRWRVNLELRNVSETDIEIIDMSIEEPSEVVVNPTQVYIPAFSRVFVSATSDLDSCPEPDTNVAHGKLQIRYLKGSDPAERIVDL
ncbi:MAG: hypothetical protein V3V01_10565 [Acidimicrobiales bacterium]